MAQERQSYSKSTKYQPAIQSRQTIINRSQSHNVYGAGPGGSRSMTMRQSFGPAAGVSFKQGVLGKMSSDNVSNVMDTREREKKEMQSLNERFASYIEKVRYLEAQNMQLLVEIDKLKKKKGFDVDKMKEMYTEELQQARKVIDDLATEKADFDAKMVGLQDSFDSEISIRIDAEKAAEELRLKVDKLNNQIGDYEGEVYSLRARVANQEDEILKLRDLIAKLQADNKRIRFDLDGETSSHIKEANRAQSLEEQMRFDADIYQTEIDELRKLIDTDKTTETRDFWQGKLSSCIREIQGEYERQLDIMRTDMQSRMEMQMRELNSGVQKDVVDSGMVKEESKKLRSKMNEQGGRLAELEANNAQLRAQLQSIMEQYEKSEFELESERNSHRVDIEQLRAEIEAMIRELSILGDAKLSLELEIACYAKLLDGEEQTLNKLMGQAVGSKSKGGSALADMVQQSSTGRLTVQRSARGHCAFKEASPDGSYVILENTSMKGSRGKPQNMSGWKITRQCGDDVVEFDFTDNTQLDPEGQLKIWSAGNAKQKGKGDLVSKCFSWGAGSGMFKLYDDLGVEKASLTIKFT